MKKEEEDRVVIPNLILRSGLILHAAAALHCKTTEIFHAALLVYRVRGRVRCAATICNSNKKVAPLPLLACKTAAASACRCRYFKKNK